MYYVIERNYVGPNADQHVSAHALEIHSEPARGNRDGQPIILDGWCGTTNDWAVYAHGEFETIEAARAEIARQTAGEYREDYIEGHEIMVGTPEHDDFYNIVIERYLAGAREQWGTESTQEWCWPARDEITADSSDDQIAAIVNECLEAGRDEVNADLDADAIRDLLTEAREDAQDDAE